MFPTERQAGKQEKDRENRTRKIMSKSEREGKRKGKGREDKDKEEERAAEIHASATEYKGLDTWACLFKKRTPQQMEFGFANSFLFEKKKPKKKKKKKKTVPLSSMGGVRLKTPYLVII